MQRSDIRRSSRRGSRRGSRSQGTSVSGRSDQPFVLPCGAALRAIVPPVLPPVTLPTFRPFRLPYQRTVTPSYRPTIARPLPHHARFAGTTSAVVSTICFGRSPGSSPVAKIDSSCSVVNPDTTASTLALITPSTFTFNVCGS